MNDQTTRNPDRDESTRTGHWLQLANGDFVNLLLVPRIYNDCRPDGTLFATRLADLRGDTMIELGVDRDGDQVAAIGVYLTDWMARAEPTGEASS